MEPSYFQLTYGGADVKVTSDDPVEFRELFTLLSEYFLKGRADGAVPLPAVKSTASLSESVAGMKRRLSNPDLADPLGVTVFANSPELNAAPEPLPLENPADNPAVAIALLPDRTLQLLQIICDNPGKSVNQLADLIGMTGQSVRNHLKPLEKYKLVVGVREPTGNKNWKGVPLKASFWYTTDEVPTPDIEPVLDAEPETASAPDTVSASVPTTAPAPAALTGYDLPFDPSDIPEPVFVLIPKQKREDLWTKIKHLLDGEVLSSCDIAEMLDMTGPYQRKQVTHLVWQLLRDGHIIGVRERGTGKALYHLPA